MAARGGAGGGGSGGASSGGGGGGVADAYATSLIGKQLMGSSRRRWRIVALELASRGSSGSAYLLVRALDASGAQLARCQNTAVARRTHSLVLAEMTKSPPEGISVGPKGDDLYTWEVLIVGSTGTPLEGGIFKSELKFPADFPSNPPEMRFVSEMWHPNIFPDGKVCISILHPPGVDKTNEGETADERWRPILGVESILHSVVLMLNEPNVSSPANIDAAKMYRDDIKAYNRKVRKTAEKSVE